MMAAAPFQLDDHLRFKIGDQPVEVALQLVDEPFSGFGGFTELLGDRRCRRHVTLSGLGG